MDKEALLVKVIELSGLERYTKKLFDTTINEYIENLPKDIPEKAIPIISEFFSSAKETLIKETTVFLTDYLGQNFTEDELQEIIDIYQRPVFKKIMSELTNKEMVLKSIELGRRIASKEFEKIKPRLDEVFEKEWL